MTRCLEYANFFAMRKETLAILNKGKGQCLHSTSQNVRTWRIIPVEQRKERGWRKTDWTTRNLGSYYTETDVEFNSWHFSSRRTERKKEGRMISIMMKETFLRIYALNVFFKALYESLSRIVFFVNDMMD